MISSAWNHSMILLAFIGHSNLSLFICKWLFLKLLNELGIIMLLALLVLTLVQYTWLVEASVLQLLIKKLRVAVSIARGRALSLMHFILRLTALEWEENYVAFLHRVRMAVFLLLRQLQFLILLHLLTFLFLCNDALSFKADQNRWLDFWFLLGLVQRQAALPAACHWLLESSFAIFIFQTWAFPIFVIGYLRIDF